MFASTSVQVAALCPSVRNYLSLLHLSVQIHASLPIPISPTGLLLAYGSPFLPWFTIPTTLFHSKQELVDVATVSVHFCKVVHPRL
jgi:hypothetical protein